MIAPSIQTEHGWSQPGQTCSAAQGLKAARLAIQAPGTRRAHVNGKSALEPPVANKALRREAKSPAVFPILIIFRLHHTRHNDGSSGGRAAEVSLARSATQLLAHHLPSRLSDGAGDLRLFHDRPAADGSWDTMVCAQITPITTPESNMKPGSSHTQSQCPQWQSSSSSSSSSSSANANSSPAS